MTARHMYYEAATERDKYNSRGSNQILLNDKDRKYALWTAQRGQSLLSTIVHHQGVPQTDFEDLGDRLTDQIHQPWHQ